MSRFDLPQEFFDRTDSRLLVKPEPQYLYGIWFMDALALDLTPPEMLGVAGREVGGVGAAYTAAERDRLRLSNPLSRDICSAKVDFTAAPGGTVRLNRPVYANTTYTEASRKIPSGTSISTTPTRIGSEQNNLTLFRYGGPYDATNSRVAPFPIEAFDANMGVHRQSSIVGTQLARDMHRFIDAVQVSLFDLAATAIYPDGMTAVNDATVAGMFPFTYEQLTRIERDMDIANLPTFADGFRALVLTPTQLQQLDRDPEYQKSARFFPEYNVLFPHVYEKSCKKFHIFRSTTLNTTNNSSSVAIQYGHAIAPGAMLAGMGRRPRVASSTDDNYGETAKVIWIADLGFGLSDSSFVYSVRSSG